MAKIDLVVREGTGEEVEGDGEGRALREGRSEGEEKFRNRSDSDKIFRANLCEAAQGRFTNHSPSLPAGINSHHAVVLHRQPQK